MRSVRNSRNNMKRKSQVEALEGKIKMPSMVHLRDSDIPDLKKWEVGKEYEVKLRLKQKSKNEDEDGGMSASFEVMNGGDDSEDEE